MRKTITISVNDVLDLVASAPGYGYDHNILLYSMAQFLNFQLSKEEIENYANGFLTEEMQKKGYGEEDAENARDVLNHFRASYCK